MQLTLLGIVLALLVVWLYLRHRARATAAAEAAAATESGNTTYHAVSIRFEANACRYAKELSGRRFLARAAPRLPLPGCNALECRCRFSHHDDRRSGKDRRSPFAARGFGPSGSGSFEKERRQGAGRRQSDTPGD